MRKSRANKQNPPEKQELLSVRVDKWLWAARFFKTRGLANQAIKSGHIQVNNQRIKPARVVTTGDEISISKEQIHWQITVLALSEQRGPAPQAQKLYIESEASIARRQTDSEARKLEHLSNPSPSTRPSKKDRRRIIQFTNKNSA